MTPTLELTPVSQDREALRIEQQRQPGGMLDPDSFLAPKGPRLDAFLRTEPDQERIDVAAYEWLQTATTAQAKGQGGGIHEDFREGLQQYEAFRKARGEDAFQYLPAAKNRTEQRAAREQVPFFRTLFSDPAKMAEAFPVEQRQSVEERFSASLDPVGEKHKAAGVMLVATMMKKPAEEVADLWPAWRERYGRDVLKISGKIDDATFYQAAGKAFENEHADDQLARDIAQKAQHAAIQGKPLADALDAGKALTGDRWNRFAPAARAGYASILSDFSDVEIKAARALFEGRAYYEGKAVESIAKGDPTKAVMQSEIDLNLSAYGADDTKRAAWVQALQSYAKAEPAARDRMLSLIGLQAEAEGETVENYFKRMGRAIMSGLDSLALAKDPYGTDTEEARAEMVMHKAKSSTDPAQQRQAADAEAYLRGRDAFMADLSTSGIKVRKYLDDKRAGFWDSAGDFGIMAGESLPVMAAAGLPGGVGLPQVIDSYKQRNLSNLRREAPNVDEASLEATATTSAFIEAGIDRLQWFTLGARLPKLNARLLQYGRPGAIAVGIARAGTVTAAETGQEMLQDLTPATVQEIASALDKDIPGPNWSKIITQEFESLGDIAGVSLIFGIIGGTGSTIMDYVQAPRIAKALQDRDALALAGYTPETIEEVATLATSNPAAAAETLKAAQIETSKEERQANAQAARATLEAEAAETSDISEAGLPTMEKQPDGTVQVSFPDAPAVIVADQEQALETVREWEQSAEVDTTRSVREYLDFLTDYHSSNPEATFTGRQTESKQTLETWAGNSKERIAKANARVDILMRQAGGDMGIERPLLSEVPILGTSRAARAGAVVKMVAEIHKEGNPLTVIEEAAESVGKWLMMDGKVSPDKMVGWIRTTEQQTRTKILSDDLANMSEAERKQEVAEGFSYVAKNAAVGKIQDSALPAAVKNFFRAFKEVIAQALRIAADFARLRASGQVDPEFSHWLDVAAGLDPEFQMENLSRQMEAEMLAESMEGFTEIQAALKGKIPHPDTLRAAGDPLAGEVARLHEGMMNNPENGANKAARTRKTNEWFLPKGAAGNLDELRRALNEQGFDFQTPAEMIDAADLSINYGRKQYGTSEADAQEDPDSWEPTFSIDFPSAGFIRPLDISSDQVDSPVDERNRDPQSILETLTGSKGDGRGNAETDGKKRRKHGRDLATGERLAEWAKENGRILDPLPLLERAELSRIAGGEHRVIEDEESGRVVKLTKPGFFGAQGEDAGAYLQRWALHNRAFGDDVAFEGLVTLAGEDAPRAVISQAFAKGRDATPEEQRDFMIEKGFHEMADSRWIHPVRGIVAWDTITPGNAIMTESGVKFIDLQMAPAPADELKTLRQQTGIGRDSTFSIALRNDPLLAAIEARIKSPEKKAEVYQKMKARVAAVKRRFEDRRLRGDFDAEGNTIDKARFEQIRDLAILEAVGKSMPPDIRGKIVGSFRKVADLKTTKARAEYIAALLPRIESALESSLVRHYRAAIRRQVNQAAFKVAESRTRGGKIGALGHAVFEEAKAAIRITDDPAGKIGGRTAAEKAEEIAARLRDTLESAPNLTDEQIAELDGRISAVELFGNYGNADSARLEEALGFLNGTYAEGRREWLDVLTARRDVRSARVAIVEEAMGREGPPTDAERTAAIRRDEGTLKRIDEAIMQAGLSGSQKIRRLGELSTDPAIKDLAEDMEIAFLEAENQESDTNDADNRALAAAMRKIFNVSTEYGVAKKLRELTTANGAAPVEKIEGSKTETVKVPLQYIESILAGELDALESGGEKFAAEVKAFDDQDLAQLEQAWEQFNELPQEAQAKKRNLSFDRRVSAGDRQTIGPVNQLEGLQLYLTMRQPDQAVKLARLGYDETTLDQLETWLKPEVKALGAWMVDHIGAEAFTLDSIHRAEKGVGLKLVENYFPVRNDVAGADNTGLSINGGAIQHTGRSIGAIKERVANNAPPAYVNAVAVFLANRAQVNFWKSHVATLREWGGVIRDERFASAVKIRMGETFYQSLDTMLKRIESGGALNAAKLMGWEKVIKSMTSSFAVGTLGGRVSTLAVNVAAGLNAGLEIPAGELAAGFTEVLARPEAFKDAFNSPAIQRRLLQGSSFEAQLAKSSGPSNRPTIATLSAAAQRGVMPINWVDTGANVIGAAVVWEHTRKNSLRAGMTEDEARTAADRKVSRLLLRAAQPTTRLAKSELELKALENPLAALFTLFTSEPRKTLAILYMAGRELTTGKGTYGKAMAAQQLFVAVVIFQTADFLIRQAYAALAKADDDEPESFLDRLRARIFDAKAWAYALTTTHLRSVPIGGEVWNQTWAKIFDQKSFQSSQNPLNRATREVLTFEKPETTEEAIDGAIDILQGVGPVIPGGSVFAQGGNAAEFITGVATSNGLDFSDDDRAARIKSRFSKFKTELDTLHGKTQQPTGKKGKDGKPATRTNERIQAAKWSAMADRLRSDLAPASPEIRARVLDTINAPEEVKKRVTKELNHTAP